MPTAILRTVIETQSAAAEAKLAAYGRSVNSTASRASQTLGKFGVTAGQAFAVAGAAAVAFVASSIKAYAEHQRVVALLQNQLEHMPQLVGSTTQAFEKQATALQKLTAFSDEEVLAADTVLTRFKLTQQEIQAAIPTVLDYAQAVGIDATTAATNLGKGSIGMGRALTSVGIKLTTAQKAGLTFSKTIELMKGKVDGTAKAFGDTFEGKLQKLQNRFNDLQEALGKQIIPALTGAADAAIKFLDAIDKIGEKIGGGRVQGLIDLTGQTNLFSAATNLASGNVKEAGRRFADWLNPIDSLKQALTGSSDATKEQTEATKGIVEQTPAAKAAMEEQAAAMKEMRSAARGIREAVKGASDAFSDLSDNGKITAKELVDAFDKQLAAARNFSRNIRTLVSRGLSPEEIQNFIDTVGADAPAALETLAHASGDVLGRVQDDMLRTQNSAREAGRFATGLKTKLDEIPNHVDTHFRAIGADVWAAEVAKVVGSLALIPRGVTTTFSSPTFRRQHQGGYVFHGGGDVPRFHSGDEVPAILQRGEFVMSRQAVNAWGVNMMRAMNSGSPSAATQVREETHYHFDVPTDQAVTKLDHMTTWRRRSRGYTGGPF